MCVCVYTSTTLASSPDRTSADEMSPLVDPTLETNRQSPARLLFLSAAAISSAAAGIVLAPPLIRLAALEAPRAYAAAMTWLTPPYLYFVVNGIILTIAASSRFHKATGDPPEEAERTDREHPRKFAEVVAVDHDEPLLDIGASEQAELLQTTKIGSEQAEFVETTMIGTEPVDVVEKPAAAEEKLCKWGSGEIQVEFPSAPTASARFGGRRSGSKAHPPASNPLRVARSRRSETLENTWKMITEGRSMPLARHLKKSDTWETRNAKSREQPLSSEEAPRRAEAPPRREPSLGQEELNRRVEAFIHKFNEEMRIQREESLQRYWDMVNGSK